MSSKWHQTPECPLQAWCVKADAAQSFAMKYIHSWRPIE
jgi:hypothetical protein